MKKKAKNIFRNNLSIVRQLIACFLLHGISEGQSIRDVPIYIPDDLKLNRFNYKYYARVLNGGDSILVSGEKVVWRYSFEWYAYPYDKSAKILLKQSESAMYFISDNKNYYDVIINGKMARIKKPSNIEPLRVFSFADVSIKDATEKIIRHRLGAPDSIEEENGRKKYIYKSPLVSITRPTYDTVRGTASGKVTIGENTENIKLDTVTELHGEEKITFQPYYFIIYFDEKSLNNKVIDLVERNAEWVKK